MGIYDQPTEEPPHFCNDCCGTCKQCPCECCGACGAAPDVKCEPMCPEQLDRTNTRLMFQLDAQTERIASLEADNARMASEQQHCAKCGGVECHALAGLFCGEHSYEGCREWGGCPICVNARLAGENATVIEARNHLFGRVRALDIETVNQRTHIAQLREQNAALVEAAEDAEKRVKALVGGMEAGSAIWSNNQYDKGWCAALTAALREIRIAKSALAASGRGE